MNSSGVMRRCLRAGVVGLSAAALAAALAWAFNA